MTEHHEKPFRLEARKVALSNVRFEVFLDTLVGAGDPIVRDFLIVRPRCHSQGATGVCVLPEIEGRIGLMHTYRHQFEEYIWQAPAGFIEENETPGDTALRELTEETGLVCDPENLISLGRFIPDAGVIDSKVAVFLARQCRPLETYKVEYEPGLGQLRFFDIDEIAEILERGSEIGGATMVACLKWREIRG